MNFYKSVKKNLQEADVFDSANQLMASIADDIETAFTGFEGKFDFGRPDGSTRNTVNGEPFIDSISYVVYFGDLSFVFEVSLNNIALSRATYDPNIIWRHYGSRGSGVKSFSVDDANKLAEATKIAYDLKSKIQAQFDDFINANPFPEEGE
jgi:hypothetical protein